MSRPRKSTRFDLELLLGAESGALTGKLIYATRLMSHGDAAVIAGDFCTLADQLTAHPDGTIMDAWAELRVDSRDKRRGRQTLPLGAGPTHEPTSATIPDLFESQAARSPQAIALRSEGMSVSYGELNERANRLARLLVRRGVGPEDTVGVFFDRSPRFIESVLAVLKSGAAYLPLEPEDPPLRLGQLCDEAAPALVITDRRLAPLLPSDARPVLDLDTDVMVAERAQVSPSNITDGERRSPLHPTNLAYVIFTSGSTGRPKGVMIPHRGIVARVLWLRDSLGLNGTDRVLQKTPYGFDVSVAEVLGALVCGASLVLARPGGHQDPSHLVDLITSEGVTTVHFVPSMLRVFLEDGTAGRCRSLRRVLASGEALPAAVRDQCLATLSVPLLNLYGPTEASVDVTSTECQAGTPVTIGRPMPGVSVYVLNDRLHSVPIGVPGELYLAGVHLARGYVSRPGATAQRFLPNPLGAPGSQMYRTGDIVRWNTEGLLEYEGRADDQVKISGIRVEPGEVAEVLGRHPAVAHATVLARGTGAGGPTLVAYLVARPAESDLPARVRPWLEQRLPRHLRPASYIVLDELPLTPNGKLDTARLPEPSRFPAAGPSTPRTETERAVLRVFTQVLGHDVGPESDFFDNGGNSLGAIRIVTRLRSTVDHRTTVRDVFDAPTPRALAHRLDSLPAASTPREPIA